MTERARFANQEADYQKLNLSDTIEPWEDGMRTSESGENFEWWYFDAHLSDGSALVITFYDKSITSPSDGLKPAITIDLDRPNGTHISNELPFDSETFHASHDHTDVRIADNYFRGDLKHYDILAATQDVKAEISFDNVTPAWRPTTGYIYFGNHDQSNFSWLPATPRGEASVKLTVNGQTETLTGVCYHDHNWGNVQMLKVMHHWYWGRANIDDYTVISSYITAEKKYGYQELPIFMLAKGDKILADDPQYLTYTESDPVIDKKTQKPVHHKLEYDYNDGQQHYRVTYTWQQTVLDTRMVDLLPQPKRALAKLAHFDGAYLRFTGDVQLERFDGETVVETHHSVALWEEMYFGKTLPMVAKK
ncbi:MAG TPA: hydroxyneurosporene dehydrogenase [Lactobacillus sp.]|nr:hydroxyneurosporene dehydrogenase [Lactobacillus sp.]